MGTFILIYAILAIVMPEEPEEVTRQKRHEKPNVIFRTFMENSQSRRKEAEDVEEIDEDEWSDF